MLVSQQLKPFLHRSVPPSVAVSISLSKNTPGIPKRARPSGVHYTSLATTRAPVLSLTGNILGRAECRSRFVQASAVG